MTRRTASPAIQSRQSHRSIEVVQHLHRQSPRQGAALLRTCITALLLAGGPALNPLVSAQEAEWIWSPEHTKENVPHVVCHFRKSIRLTRPESGKLIIGADDQYEVFINGRRIGTGGLARRLDEFDISNNLRSGLNVFAVRVANRNGSTAALAARVLIKEEGEDWASYSTDATWLTQLNPLPLWNTSIYNDGRWPKAQSFGVLGDTPPWDMPEGLAEEEKTESQRFEIASGFRVQRLMDEGTTGSLIAMAFNEFGHVVASQGGGPLLLIYDSDDDGDYDTVKKYCEKVKNCHGILPLNGKVFVTADGPEGPGLYLLEDKDRNGELEQAKLIVPFKGESLGEHGAHGITLGPDGMIYIAVGNHTVPDRKLEETSPHRVFYEGMLTQPKYEDPGGHAVGIEPPGGTIIRTDLKGAKVELVAGGLRNAYDLAFNKQGELFTFDSDMESDIGTSWYRPTHIYQVLPGGEYGWRSGWSKWPTYFSDSLPPIGEAGRGSPTGVTVYNHVIFPSKYHNAVFLADWSEGRILAATMKQQGATYTTNVEVFLRGEPLNVTDMEVGPDGALYFVTGGRTTRGGLYRISWSGPVAEELKNFGEGITQVIRYPQLQSAYTRQRIARLKNELGDDWSRLLSGVARSTANPWPYRTRALDVLQLFGPTPDAKLLVELADSNSEAVRAKAADLMGLQSNEKTQEALVKLLDDNDRLVRRKACEALVRSGQTAPAAKLIELIASDDRAEAWAARRLLERVEVASWRDEVLTSDNHRVFIQGCLALMLAEPSRANALDITDAFQQLLADFVSDKDFVDMLRMLQVVLERGDVQRTELADLAAVLAEEFPAGESRMNRELIRLLSYLNVDSIMSRYLEYIEGDSPYVDRLHVALHLRYIATNWTSEQKVRFIQFLEEARTRKGGNSMPLYIENVLRDFCRGLTSDEASVVLAKGELWPAAATGALYTLPPTLSDDQIADLITLDEKLKNKTGNEYQRLKVGIVAVLSRSGGETALVHLRSVWNDDPERRSVVAIALAQHPNDENWGYLVRSIHLLQGDIARDVLVKLLEIEKAPAEAKYYRNVILAGLRLQEDGGADAVRLLEYWTGESFGVDSESWETSVANTQEWFGATYPDELEAKLPQVSSDAKYKLDELVDYLQSEEGRKASPTRGYEVYAKAECIKCHRLDNRGESMGPDLTSLRRRFTRRELLQSMLFPSHVISDQYAGKNIILTDGRTFSGLVAPGGEGEIIVLQNDGRKLSILEKDIKEMSTSKVSAMPAGLLDRLTLEEIGDLISYVMQDAKARVARRPDDE